MSNTPDPAAHLIGNVVAMAIEAETRKMVESMQLILQSGGISAVAAHMIVITCMYKQFLRQKNIFEAAVVGAEDKEAVQKCLEGLQEALAKTSEKAVKEKNKMDELVKDKLRGSGSR